jgi:2-iminobutanoate/2-iminopropanoate deaminase
LAIYPQTKNWRRLINLQSQATKANGTIYLAGQIAAGNSGNLLEGSIAEKAHQILRNSEAILKEAGSGLDRVAKVTVSWIFTIADNLKIMIYQVYVTSMGLLPEFNAVYNTYFPHKPARTSMAVTGLPLGVEIEVDIVAVE